MTIDVFIVHSGNQNYLSDCVKSCSKFHQVHLLGDQSNKELTENWSELSKIKSPFLDEFSKTYKHMSSNSFDFEKICFDRYIYMYEYAKKNNINHFMHCDSDLILLDEIDSSILDRLKCFDAAVMVPTSQKQFRYTASPHISYWSLTGLKCFIEFFINAYRYLDVRLVDKYNHHRVNHIPGGICDMTLLYLFYQDNNKVCNLFDFDDNIVFDFNVSLIENGKFIHRSFFSMKKYHIENGILYYLYVDKPRKVVCLHMQGKAKLMIKYAIRRQFHRLFLNLCILNFARKMKSIFFLLPRKG